MADKNKILRSINGHDDSICVDVFMRPDGSFGFEEYRRDVEDACGWFPIGYYAQQVFQSEAAAFAAACQSIVWLQADHQPDTITHNR